MKNKLKLIGTGLLFGSSLLATISVISYSQKIVIPKDKDYIIGQNEEFKYLFEGKYYDSLDNITNELLNNNPYINSEMYYGDAHNAIFDHETNRLNINELKKFDQDKISSAYINAFGNHEQDFVKAKRSFVNEGLVKYKYQDTKGKLHSSYEEAKAEIINGIKVDETLYYEVKDDKNNTKKINPLNAQDINEVKRIAYNIAKSKASKNTTNSSSDFDILPMFKKKDPNSDSISYHSLGEKSLLKNIFTDKYIDIYKEIWNTYQSKLGGDLITNIEKNLKISKVKYDITVGFEYTSNNNHGAILAYDIKSKNALGDILDVKTERTHKKVDRIKELTFKNVGYDFLNNFNVFLNRETWKNELDTGGKVERKTQSHGWTNEYERSDYLVFNNFLGNGIKFEIYSIGDDGGTIGNPGINTQILKKGRTYGKQLSFKTNIAISNESKSDFLQTLESTLIKKLLHQGVLSTENELDNEIMSALILELMKNINNFNEIVYNNKDITGDENVGVMENNSISGITKNLENMILTFINIQNDAENNNLISTIINIVLNTSKDMDYFLTYNDLPIFKITNDFINKINDYDLALENDIRKKSFFDLYFIELEKYTNPSKINKIDPFKNISNSNFIDGQLFLDKQNKPVNTEIKDDLFTIPNDIPEYQGTLHVEVNKKKQYVDNLYFALNSYNNNLKKIKENNPNGLPEIIENKLIKDANNILVLKTKHSTPSIETITYGNFISLTYEFNESLSKNQKTLIYDSPTLGSSIAASSILNPAKVIVVYDLSGNVINPGITLSDDLILESTSDAMYDSERTILDNIYRTLIIKKDPNKIYYKNEDDTHTLLDYKTNFIYKLDYNKRISYFLTYNDAWLYLREIVKINAQKINFKERENEVK